MRWWCGAGPCFIAGCGGSPSIDPAHLPSFPPGVDIGSGVACRSSLMLDPRFSSQPRERSLPPSSALQLGLNQAIPPHLSADSSAGGILGQKAIYFFAAPLWGDASHAGERFGWFLQHISSAKSVDISWVPIWNEYDGLPSGFWTNALILVFFLLLCLLSHDPRKQLLPHLASVSGRFENQPAVEGFHCRVKEPVWLKLGF